MFDRIMRAVRLDPTLYRQVADNPQFMNESLIIVIAVALLSSIGVVINSQNAAVAYIVQVINSILFGWLLWSLVAYFVGTRFFGGVSTLNETLRTLGYANAPRLLGLLGFIPCVGWIFTLAGWLLGLVAGVIAIRETMEFDTTKAVVTSLIGLVLFIIASVVVGLTLAVFTFPFQ